MEEIFYDPIPKFLQKPVYWNTKEIIINSAILLLLLLIYGGF